MADDMNLSCSCGKEASKVIMRAENKLLLSVCDRYPKCRTYNEEITMAKVVIVDQESFNRVFESLELQYKDDFDFMKSDEMVEEFHDSKRYLMLNKFRSTIKNLKKKLEQLDVC